MKRKVTAISLFCIYIASVLYLCLMKPDDMPQFELSFFGIPMDKIAHFLMFLPFPVLSYLLFYEGQRKITHEVLILTAILSLGVGLAFGTEQLQAMTQYRSSDIMDVYSDMTGLATGCIAAIILIIIKRHRK